jgi:kinesin family protein 6/9
MYDTIANRSHVQYDPYTPGQKSQLQKKIKDFIESEGDFDIVNLREVKETLGIFRLMIKNADSSKEIISKDVGNTVEPSIELKKDVVNYFH